MNFGLDLFTNSVNDSSLINSVGRQDQNISLWVSLQSTHTVHASRVRFSSVAPCFSRRRRDHSRCVLTPSLQQQQQHRPRHVSTGRNCCAASSLMLFIVSWLRSARKPSEYPLQNPRKFFYGNDQCGNMDTA